MTGRIVEHPPDIGIGLGLRLDGAELDCPHLDCIEVGHGQLEVDLVGYRRLGPVRRLVTGTISGSSHSSAARRARASGSIPLAPTVAQLVRTLEENGAMEYSIVVAATASERSLLEHRFGSGVCLPTRGSRE